MQGYPENLDLFKSWQEKFRTRQQTTSHFSFTMSSQRATHSSASKKNSVKRALDFGSDDDDDSAGGVELRINEEYAKRFEHNKKREELQRCMCVIFAENRKTFLTP